MTVHLARKWRSKNFNELVGQELSVRILKNSLFKKAFFPAYLFSGLRGSGKTSMGRIFAAAVNCHSLDEFIASPKTVILPCGTCASCAALFSGRHPDFIEIDAASHTGVDNMRLIIENASMLPTLARKKIYLIDEAHMLSKAAFNAALKILEEPPVHVMFILATTDPEKIIETITSRCFQIFFDPILLQTLVEHLKHICREEKIDADDEGLSLIAEQSGGSVRDALTLLERVALACDNKVTGEAVTTVLGLIGKQMIIELYGYIKNNAKHELLACLKRNRYDAYALWKALTEHIRKDLYIPAHYHEYERTLYYLKISYHTEQLLAKTSMADAVVEYMLLSMCNSETTAVAPKITQELPKEPVKAVSSPTIAPYSSVPAWNIFIEEIKTQVEPLVFTLFSSAQVVELDQKAGRCAIACLKEHELFKEWIDNSRTIWKPLLIKACGGPIELDVRFTLSKSATQPVQQRNVVQQQAPIRKPLSQQVSSQTAAHSQTITQALKIFPGTIQEV